MRKEQREQLKEAMGHLGSGIKKTEGQKFDKVAEETLASQKLPQNVLGLSDTMVEGLYSQAYRLYNSGKFNDACDLFRLLVMIKGTEAKFALGLAACYHMLKSYDSALSTYSLCSTMDPTSPLPHYHASDCYIQLNDNASALISLEMTVKRAGKKPEFQALKDRSLMMMESLKKKLHTVPAKGTATKPKEKKKKKE